jgi:hypothetical protein
MGGGLSVLMGVVVLLAGCGGAATPSPASSSAASAAAPSASPAASPSPATSASPAASSQASPSPEASAAPTALDPCQLVTPAEASSLTGGSFSSGQQSTTPDGGRICTYGAEGIVFEVLVGQATDAATAKAQEPAFKADLEKALTQAGIANPTLTELPGFESGVDAATIEGSMSLAGQKIGAIALYALKGRTFLAISDIAVGGSVPTSAQMQAQGHTSLARIP